MNYAYIRVSTDKQNLDNQKNEILNYANNKKIFIDQFIDETISSRKNNRKIYDLIESLQKGDILIVTELSRLARSMLEMDKIYSIIQEKGIQLLVVKSDGVNFDDSIQAQCFKFALSLAAQIERDMISSRTKAGLNALKAKGVKLGRKVGTGIKLKGREKEIIDQLKLGVSVSRIAVNMGVNRLTMTSFIKKNKLKG